ncbi:MAG: PQQ-binding-like beta-propeller repeat protein [Gammaproteobacteria bacterium]|nr:PQQ-binding-like beta-propeller repeat protein [Gammaproteobacteria bacterium]NNM14448.1 PQQ-binding-like beta-propeller repeat protein [Gammaproteobacteria bacterium]
MSKLKLLRCIPLLLFFTSMLACVSNKPDATPELTESWVLENLDSPESVVLSTDKSFYYVSNVNGEGDAKDENGYIARVSLQGELLQQYWASGLNGPKGLALSGTTLYVSDIDQLVAIDTATGQIIKRVDVPGAKFLNDVAVSSVGVLVSDSANARIYNYVDDSISVWFEDERLGGVNGLLPQTNRLLITTMSKGELLSLEWESKTLSVLAGDMKNADGIVMLDNGSFIVSSWPGKLYHIDNQGMQSLLLDTSEQPVYLNDFLLVGNTLIVPNWQPGSIRSFILE